MDNVDVRLLAALMGGRGWQFTDWNPRTSIRRVAEAAGLPVSTAWARIQAWEDNGFFSSYHTLLHPSLLGGRLVYTNVRIDRDKRAEFEAAVDSLEGLVQVDSHIHDRYTLGLIERSTPAAERRLELLTKLPGVEKAEILGALDGISPAARKPDRLDLEIMKRILTTEKLGQGPSIEDLGVTERTVHRRMSSLFADHVAWSLPTLDYRRLQGVFVMLIAWHDDDLSFEEIRDRITAALPDAFTYGQSMARLDGTHLPLWQGFWVIENTGQLQERMETLEAVPGVRSVKMNHPYSVTVKTGWIEDRLDQLLQAT